MVRRGLVLAWAALPSVVLWRRFTVPDVSRITRVSSERSVGLNLSPLTRLCVAHGPRDVIAVTVAPAMATRSVELSDKGAWAQVTKGSEPLAVRA